MRIGTKASPKGKDKEGKKVRKQRSMPYAICSVITSKDPSIPAGAEFTIAGYMLQNVTVKGETSLAFHNKYVAEFADKLVHHCVILALNTGHVLHSRVTLCDFERGVDVRLGERTTRHEVGHETTDGAVVLLQVSASEAVFIIKL